MRSDGEGRVRIEEQAVDGSGPKWKPVVRQRCKRERSLCRFEVEEPCDGSDLTVVFQEAVTFNWINQLSNTTIWWLDIYVVYYIGINYMFRLLWPSSG